MSLEIQRSQYIRPNVTVHKCAETIWGNTVFLNQSYSRVQKSIKYYISRYRISSYSFRTFMYCELWPYVFGFGFGLDFQIQKKIVSLETIWGNTVHNFCTNFCCGNYSRVETNQGRKILIFWRFWPRKLSKGGNTLVYTFVTKLLLLRSMNELDFYFSHIKFTGILVIFYFP